MDFIIETIRRFWDFITDVQGLVQMFGYVGLAIIVFTETGLMVGFFLPGDSLLVTAGLFAAKGDLNIVFLNALLMSCAILGDATGYYIGKKLGPTIFRKEDSFFFKKKHLIATQEFYERHGGKTIIIARFVPIIRTFAPVVAGMANMSYRRFAMFNIIGGMGWVFSMTMVGYSLIKLFPKAEEYIHVIIVVVVLVSLLPGVIEILRARMRSRKSA